MKYYPQTQKQITFLQEIFSIDSTSRILDIGCEDGKHLLELQKISQTIFGVDIKPDVILPNVITGNIFDVKLPTELDGAYLMSPYFGNRWDDYNILLEKLNPCTKKGGKIVIDLFNFNSFPNDGGYNDYTILDSKIILSNYTRHEAFMECERTLVFRDWTQKTINLKWKVFSQELLETICQKTGYKIQGLYLDFDINQPCTFEIPKNKKRRVVVLQKL
jgi:SAM-dependent methyltransferase